MKTIMETAADKFLTFHCALLGYNIYLNNVKKEKYEVFASGITNAQLILKGKTAYKLEVKVCEYNEVA